MHELSLTQSILDIIEDYARKYSFRKLNSLKLSFGRLSSIDPNSLEFAFEVISKGTVAEGAVLEFEIRPIVISCFSCAMDSEIEVFSSVCPLCHGKEVMIVGGNEELKLLEMEVD